MNKSGISRRTFVAAAAVAGCSPIVTPSGFRFFSQGNPKHPPLVVAPVNFAGLAGQLRQAQIDSFVAAGFYVVGMHWPGMDGGDQDYGARHKQIAGWLRLLGIERPAMFAQSRGALQLLNFACDHPDSFSKIACLYPVTDPFVYPGKGDVLWKAYGTTEEGFSAYEHTPNARAHRLRGKAIKIWHGDRDETVPKRRTTDIFAARSGAQVVTLKGVGHDRVWPDEIPAWLRG